MPKLEVKSDGQERVVPFDKPEITIGRQADNDLVIDDVKASRRHCIIRHSKGTFRLKDLKSHNGTWIGANKVSEAILALGDTLRIGETYIRLLPDEVRGANLKSLPTAQVIIEEEEELPASPVQSSAIRSMAAVKALGTGPLSRQLGPLIEACAHVPTPEGAPDRMQDLKLLDRKAQPVALERGRAAGPSEALEAFRQLLFVAFRTRTTDIHIEPKPNVYALRFRIDGLLHPVGEVTAKTGQAVLNVVKVLCQLDIAKRNIVQEGNFSVELPNRRVDFRISMTPSVHGQKLALRFLDKATVPDLFESLGMELDAVAELQRASQQDAGMIILAGPTGSGKTTTLYTALKSVDSTTRNIVTIEDPVEYELPTATQISIDPGHNLTFASVLSSILRQDPDVILVGEVRDRETAKLAMQAAMTGHLVMTTLHARDTIGTIFRLLDLGVEPFLIANSVSLCISQRLVRVLCPDCKRPFKPDAKLVRRMRLEDRPHGHFFEAVGCTRCMNVGYRGRMALFELLVFSPQIRDVILTKPTISDLRKAGGEWMFRTLADSGFRKVIEGVTTFDEVERVVGT